jgi:hypothetical protein
VVPESAPEQWQLSGSVHGQSLAVVGVREECGMKLIPQTGYLRRRLEAAAILLAAWLLAGRNVQRSGVVSRRDNNDMGYMAEQLEGIADRIKRQYP